MNIKDILAKIGATEAPLARQLLMAGLITRRLEERGRPAPVLIVDWGYLEKKAALPENGTLAELRALRERGSS